MIKIISFVLALYSSLSTHRVAISGKDIIVNNINDPYSQTEINNIANIKVIKLNEDITNLLVLVNNEYLNNERVEGVFYQTYQIIDQEYDGFEYYDVIYEYVLTIYNVNVEIESEEVTIKTTPNNHLSKSDIIYQLENILNTEIFSYEIVKSNYENNGIEGNYLMELIVTTNKNKKIYIKVYIDSFEIDEQTPIKLILIGSASIFAIGFILIKIIIRRRK